MHVPHSSSPSPRTENPRTQASRTQSELPVGRNGSANFEYKNGKYNKLLKIYGVLPLHTASKASTEPSSTSAIPSNFRLRTLPVWCLLTFPRLASHPTVTSPEPLRRLVRCLKPSLSVMRGFDHMHSLHPRASISSSRLADTHGLQSSRSYPVHADAL